MASASEVEAMIDQVFNACVELLLWLAALLGMSYQAVNVWIFCALWPLFTLFLLAVVIYQRRVIRVLRHAETQHRK